MDSNQFKILEVFGSSEGCRVNLYPIPDDVGLIILGDMEELRRSLGEKLSQFADNVREHNAKVEGF